MTTNEIRKIFLDFFESKQHEIFPSDSMVIKNDPTLMFTNAGMNQFKDIFLGHAQPKFLRVANSQKCLRVSGKHNDLEEVVHDTYHHTMFEMLGNWSLGDYFKKEAITWAWELLTEVFSIPPQHLYVTVFGGDEKDGTEKDTEAYDLWKTIVPEERILFGSKKDNFWEMGETGPCGPCSEIHVDIRSEEEKAKVSGRELVNKDHPLVIEIWNLVFIQYNRLANGSLSLLPNKYVDTGMGLERLAMVLQGKQSNYDTDIFQSLIGEIALLSQKTYGAQSDSDIAMRVIADHLRAVSFAIADGQLPSNTGAGYVIRRILRRAVRYGYTFLNLNKPFLHSLVSKLVALMGAYFSELTHQQHLIEKVLLEEEQSFLRTLSQGIQKFENYVLTHPKPLIDGQFAFELFDTYGFPIDLTQLMASEKGYTVDMEAFYQGLKAQKERSRAVASLETEDWIELHPQSTHSHFVGYDSLETECHIVKYRRIKAKGKQFYQLVLNQTPFYAEAGGQVGDKGLLESVNEKIQITNTIKENNLVLHICHTLPENLTATFLAKVDIETRKATQNNHSATHLLHYALRKVLGNHVEQKGSLVNEERFRFDFSHFEKVSEEELFKVESLVNKMVRENISVNELREISIEESKNRGAMALFGEKYGDKVRVIQFGEAIELCGGTHTSATGNIGLVKIVSEGAIAAGVRRIEALSGEKAEEYVYQFQQQNNEIKQLLNAPHSIPAIKKLIQENETYRKTVESFEQERTINFIEQIKNQLTTINNIHVIQHLGSLSPELLKNAAYHLKNEYTNLLIVFGSDAEQKPNVIVALSDDLVQTGKSAAVLVREASSFIQGGGGGQANLATAGGKNTAGLQEAIQKIIEKATT
ncbi:MAG: alanine--tRNA ligase [Bacteroidales bacterium]|nr:alanine--tRNA ligase [Bacteroidales bacterium]